MQYCEAANIGDTKVMLDGPLILTHGRVLRPGSNNPQNLDIEIGIDGRIAAVGPGLPKGEQHRAINLGNRLVVPGLIDMHQHLDKSRTRSLVKNPTGDLPGALAGYQEFAKTVTKEGILSRAERTLEACLARGTVAIRSHTNIDPDTKTRGVEAMIEFREKHADRMRVQVVAHVTSGATRMRNDAKQWLQQAIDLGADVLGGVPHISDDPIAFLDMMFDLATKSGLPLDLHVDEHLDASKLLFEPLIERTEALGLQGRVVASHSSALSAVDISTAGRIIEKLARAKIGVVTLPAANLFLQGRDAGFLSPRGLTRVDDLLAAGVLVAAGSDNIQDSFVPTGSGDMLEIARWTLLAAHLGLTDLGKAFDLVTSYPAAIMGLERDWGIHTGARGDLLITDAEDHEDLVASGALNRVVMIGGRIVSGQLT
jgi:cytosine deaminase